MRKHMVMRIALLCIVALTYGSVHALDIELDREDNTTAYVNGESNTRSYRKVMRFLDRNREVAFLVLEDIPGSSDDEYNLKLCRLLYERGITTVLFEYSVVESGGADLFACGRRLILHPEAKIGVHSWSDSDGTEGADVPRGDPVHQEYLDLYNAVDVSEEFYWFTLQAAPADGMHYMTAEETEQYFGHKTEKIDWAEIEIE